MVTEVENSLLLGELADPDLQELSELGGNGAVVCSCLMLGYGKLPPADMAVKLLVELSRHRGVDQNARRSLQAAGALLAAAKHDGAWRALYTEELSSRLASSGLDTAILGAELLSLRGFLNAGEVESIFAVVTTELYDWHGLTGLLAKWLARADLSAAWNEIDLAVTHGMVRLSSQSLDPDKGHPRDPGPYLLLPLIQWKRLGKADELSAGVFWRGLKMAIVPERVQGNLVSRGSAFGSVNPMLEVVHPNCIREAILTGGSAQDPVVRSLSRVFQLTDGQNSC
jgi:hypothetical protein